MNTQINIINHKCNENAIRLKQAFGELGKTNLIDSGSAITKEQRPHFDITLGNVYYNGMLNAIPCDGLASRDWILIVASDVSMPDSDARRLMARLHTFNDSNMGIYAPSVPAYGSPHPQMIQKAHQSIQLVPFVDGFCFAVRVGIFRKVVPVDLSINTMGWGVDFALGFHAIKSGYTCVVDHTIRVDHHIGPNLANDPAEYLQKAKLQRRDWYSSLDKGNGMGGFKLFRKLVYIHFLKNAFGARLAKALIGTQERKEPSPGV